MISKNHQTKNKQTTKKRLSILSAVVIVLAVGAIGAYKLTVSHALVNKTGKLCETATTNQDCATPKLNAIYAGNTIDVVSAGADRWERIVAAQAVTTDNGGWPFTSGSGFNTEFRGLSVVHYNLHANNRYCLSNKSQIVKLEICNTNYKAQLWVINGDKVISVGATNNHLSAYPKPQVLTNDGGQAINAKQGSFASATQNWHIFIPLSPPPLN